MKEKVKVNIFIDALGYELLKENEWFLDFLPHKKPVEMQFGYSSAAIPTILSGKQPDQHNHFSYFFYNPKNSPFKNFKLLRLLDLLPDKLSKWWKIRNVISRYLKKILGFTGYFQIYSVAFKKLLQLDYCEQEDIFSPEGINEFDNVARYMEKQEKPYFVTHWTNPEAKNFEDARTEIKKGEIEFLFLYAAELDGLLHSNDRKSKIVKEKLIYYHNQIFQIYLAAKASYKEFEINVFSDHGMTPFTESFNAIEKLKALDVKEGEDYFVVLDSTMARFWYFNEEAKEKVRKCFNDLNVGDFLNPEEKKKFGVDFDKNRFGDDIFLVNPGIQIVPSDMGLNPLVGMHGYHPHHKHSYASLISNTEKEMEIEHVKDFFQMMVA